MCRWRVLAIDAAAIADYALCIQQKHFPDAGRTESIRNDVANVLENRKRNLLGSREAGDVAV